MEETTLTLEEIEKIIDQHTSFYTGIVMEALRKQNYERAMNYQTRYDECELLRTGFIGAIKRKEKGLEP